MEIKFTFSPHDVFGSTRYFKTHRDYIKHRFAKMGYEVVKFNWDFDEHGKLQNYKYPDGIKFMQEDTQLYTYIEVTGFVGKSLRPIHKVEIKDAARDKVQDEGASPSEENTGSVRSEDPGNDSAGSTGPSDMLSGQVRSVGAEGPAEQT
jgi:hypothetical protein